MNDSKTWTSSESGYIDVVNVGTDANTAEHYTFPQNLQPKLYLLKLTPRTLPITSPVIVVNGITNYGATCYANACIQLLRRIPGILRKTASPVLNEEFLIDCVLNPNGDMRTKTTQMNDLVASLNLSRGAQEDTSEFLLRLFGIYDSVIQVRRVQLQIKNEKVVKMRPNQVEFFIAQDIINWNLLFVPDDCVNLMSTIESYKKGVQTIGDPPLSVVRQTTFSSHPLPDHILVYVAHARRTGVSFTVETTDLEFEVNGVNYTYRVVGVACHKGGLNGGHYIAHINTVANQWYKADDGDITPYTNKPDTKGWAVVFVLLERVV
jgi:hypothetical protein